MTAQHQSTGPIPGLVKTGLGLLVITLLTHPAGAEGYVRGQQLYDQQCQSCHEDLMHARNRKLKTLDALRERINNWASHTGTTWTREDVDDVLDYLNKRYYHIEQKAL
jgi:mono/diheme cytochrome c family protein